jgi:hypothetical protein
LGFPQVDDGAQVGDSIRDERFHLIDPRKLHCIIGGEFPQMPQPEGNDLGGLPIGIQVSVVARDDVTALRSLRVGHGGQDQFDEVLPERPLRQWVLSPLHALRFLLATNPDALTRVLGVVYRSISRYLLHKAGLTPATGAVGAVTLVQRFGSALNLNVHFHMLFLDGVYVNAGADPPEFRPVAAADANELQGLLEQIAARVGQVLEKRGLIERDIEGCARCGGVLKIIASIEEPDLIGKILWHLQRRERQPSVRQWPLGARAPPVQGSLI